MCGCTCSSCHIVAVDIYTCSIRCCGALLTWADQWGATSVLSVSGWTYAVVGAFCWMQVAALGLWATACLGVVGATDGCTARAVAASCTASEVDGVVIGCPPLQPWCVCVCVRLDSIWVMFTNVISCSSLLSSTNNFDDVWAMISCTYYSGREPQCPVIVDYRNRLSCIEWGFPAATCMVMVSCTLGCTFL